MTMSEQTGMRWGKDEEETQVNLLKPGLSTPFVFIDI